MTPAQLDHLRRIDAHLERLLGIAAKRTPGEWVQKANLQGRIGDIYSGDRPDTLATTLFLGWTENEMKHNATFIASCAGNAEAGWKATRAAIADWLSLYNSTEGYADGSPDATTHDKLCNEVASICRINLQHILAAFPLESLKS